MATKRSSPPRYVQPYRYPSPHIPMSAIRRFARKIAERFHPEKIILFGSYAYGKPHNESDVDLLVIMRARNVIDQSVRIVHAFEWPFALDLIVRSPQQIRQGLTEGDCDWFLVEVISKGKVLYEAPHLAMDSQGGRRSDRSKAIGCYAAGEERSRLLSLPAVSRKIPQSTSARTRIASAAHP